MPRQIPPEDLKLVAEALATGTRQNEIGEEAGWTKSRVARCVAHLRHQVATARQDFSWLDPQYHTPVQVAQAWREIAPPAEPPTTKKARSKKSGSKKASKAAPQKKQKARTV
ncbi:hypothetical protein [Nannocystis radixulma]|uniref:Homeodomain-like domain-containing protein n=1 Tax=Nannocystis radixulma TaxID=2995305 RepID=A0ABT5AZ11_9BACT|nr:hypothetical protein [Nannocystis radixulma]MDC0667082.1 hypothetical protein [Nannocystis radixulma]